MKTKLYSVITILIMLSLHASSRPIMIAGTDRVHPCYGNIYFDGNKIHCIGTGRVFCPVFSNIIFFKHSHVSLGELTEYITEEVRSGNPTGEINYQGILPARWKMIDDKNVEIEFDDEFEAMENNIPQEAR